jgi:hypothetical protein
MSEQPESKPEAQPAAKELTGRIGKFEILSPLGKGAMGMVYLAHDTKLERDVALKVMVTQIADDPELKRRFEREAKAVAKMTHPNVVTVFDFDYHTDGAPYIAMELLKGMDLQKAMRTPPPMTVERKVAIIVQVLAGLAHAHQAGIVHRDIKPANIFINTDGSVKIMDFGVARLTSASMTGTGNIVGTADYMSPEQVKGAHVDGRSDVFSVGCMLYELVAGKRPFHADNLMAIFYKITHDEANFDLIPGGEEHDALLPILRKALAKNLDERYQTAYAFAVDLRDYLRAHATSASGQHALEDLLDLEPPAGPQPGTDPGHGTDPRGATLVEESETPGGATMDLGPTASKAQAPTLRGGTGTVRAGAAPTVVGGGQGATVVGGAPTVRGERGRPATMPPTVMRQRPEPRHAPVAPPHSAANPMLYVVLGGLVVALAGTGVYIWISKQKPPELSPAPPSTVVSLTPSTTLAMAPTTTVTLAAPPKDVQDTSKAAASILAAQSAFKSGDYDRAVERAQSALREDPGNANAQKVLSNALEGQRAAGHFRAAEAALARNDFALAQTEAEAGRAGAPWDGRGPTLLQRIQDAQIRAQQMAAQQAEEKKRTALLAQVNDVLSKADGALQAQKYDEAIALYAQAASLDPQSQRALNGQSSAVQARALYLASLNTGGPRAGVKSFNSGTTVAQSIETKAETGPAGFEDSAGVVVKKGSQAADLPGKISFDIDPPHVKGGEKYTVKVNLLNEGAAPIEIASVIVTTVKNGRKASGPLTAMVKDVAPRQKALLLSLPDNWQEDTQTWSMEVIVRTTRNETYKNQVTWK